MNATPDVIRLVREWIEKAEEDLLTAQVLMAPRRTAPSATFAFTRSSALKSTLKHS